MLLQLLSLLYILLLAVNALLVRFTPSSSVRMLYRPSPKLPNESRLILKSGSTPKAIKQVQFWLILIQCNSYFVVLGGVNGWRALRWTQVLRVQTRPRRWIFKGDKNPQHAFGGGGKGWGVKPLPHVLRFYGMSIIPSKYEQKYFVKPN
jgi:hypothetical protein